MAYTFNGIGTKYYGQWKTEVDGNPGVIKTLFFCIIYVPLFPISSAIIWNETKGDGFFAGIAWSSSKSFMASKIPLFWPQILDIYSVISTVFVAFVLMASQETRGPMGIGELVMLLIFSSPSLIYLLLKTKYFSFYKTPKMIYANLIVIFVFFILRLYIFKP